MAIDRTGISSLQSGAPEIKYTGDEGPKSPTVKEMEMAGMMDSISLAFEQQNGYDISLATPEVRENFIRRSELNQEVSKITKVLERLEDKIDKLANK